MEKIKEDKIKIYEILTWGASPLTVIKVLEESFISLGYEFSYDGAMRRVTFQNHTLNEKEIEQKLLNAEKKLEELWHFKHNLMLLNIKIGQGD